MSQFILGGGDKAPETDHLAAYKEYEIDFSASTATLTALSYTTGTKKNNIFLFVLILICLFFRKKIFGMVFQTMIFNN